VPEGRIAQGLLFGTSRTGQAPHGGMHPADHGRVLDACDVRFTNWGCRVWFALLPFTKKGSHGGDAQTGSVHD